MTTWLCGVEPRWAMAAPSCFVTTFRRNMENELPADTEQCRRRPWRWAWITPTSWRRWPQADHPFGQGTRLFRRPRNRGSLRAAATAVPITGREEDVALFIGPTTHGYTQENREAMYRWFNRVTKISDATAEPPLTIEKDEVLWCTPKGQVAELGARTVFQFTRDKSQSLAAARGQVSGADLTRAVTEVLKLPPRTGVPDYRILRYLSSRGYPLKQAVAYAVETEPGIQALVYRLFQEAWYSRPPRGGARAILYVSHLSKRRRTARRAAGARSDPGRADAPVFTCDVRGIGESRPDTCGVNSFLSPYGSDFFYAIHSLMLDRPYMGQKTHDVLSVLDWLVSLGTPTCTWSRKAGRCSGHLRGGPERRRETGDAEERFDVVPRHRRVRAVRLAAVNLVAQRAGPLRPAGLLPRLAGKGTPPR